MEELVFFGIEAALVAALPVAFIVTCLFVKCAPLYTRKFLAGAAGLLVTITVFGACGVSTQWFEADIFVLFTASVAYSPVFLFAFRIRPIALRIIAVTVLGGPIVLGYAAGTAGWFVVALISIDLGSSAELNTQSGLVCRAKPFGNATTEENGYFAHLIRPIVFLERDVYKARFVDPITPEEACSRASAEYDG